MFFGRFNTFSRGNVLLIICIIYGDDSLLIFSSNFFSFEGTTAAKEKCAAVADKNPI